MRSHVDPVLSCSIAKQAPETSSIVQSETTTTATTLATGRIGRSRGDVLNAADLHAGAGEGTEGRLSTGAGGLGAVTCEGI